MEFPSAMSYEIKEKSIVGDYTISRELNDLSYTFVFPAGTTEIECMVSLNGETDWRGFSVNSAENPFYWNKDEKMPSLKQSFEDGILYNTRRGKPLQKSTKIK